MVVFLNVFITQKNKSKKQLGTLEIGKNQDTRVFEWRGMNGSDDGGIWKWDNHALYGGHYVMLLISNKTQTHIPTLNNKDWGLTEPTQPIFKPNANGRRSYYEPTGISLIAEWEKI